MEEEREEQVTEVQEVEDIEHHPQILQVQASMDKVMMAASRLPMTVVEAVVGQGQMGEIQLLIIQEGQEDQDRIIHNLLT